MKTKAKINARCSLPRPTAPTLESVQALCDAYVNVEVPIHNQKVFIAVRVLRPHEIAELEEILETVQAPAVKRDDGKVDYDTSNAEFKLNRKRILRVVRAVALWRSCKLFQDFGAGRNPSREEVFEFVQSKLTEPILESLFMVVIGQEQLGYADEAALGQQVSFT